MKGLFPRRVYKTRSELRFEFFEELNEIDHKIWNLPTYSFSEYNGVTKISYETTKDFDYVLDEANPRIVVNVRSDKGDDYNKDHIIPAPPERTMKTVYILPADALIFFGILTSIITFIVLAAII